MKPPTVRELQARLGLTPADAKCLRRLMGITMRRDSKPADEGALRAPGPYVNRRLVPAVLRFACWAMGSGGTRTVLVPDTSGVPSHLYDRVAQYVAVDAGRFTLSYDHMRSRWLLATWDGFWDGAPAWMGDRAAARVVPDREGPADDHGKLVYGCADVHLLDEYVTDPRKLDPGAVNNSDAGFHRYINAVAEDALYRNY